VAVVRVFGGVWLSLSSYWVARRRMLFGFHVSSATCFVVDPRDWIWEALLVIVIRKVWGVMLLKPVFL
jgi:hypothetical protein